MATTKRQRGNVAIQLNILKRIRKNIDKVTLSDFRTICCTELDIVDSDFNKEVANLKFNLNECELPALDEWEKYNIIPSSVGRGIGFPGLYNQYSIEYVENARKFSNSDLSLDAIKENLK